MNSHPYIAPPRQGSGDAGRGVRHVPEANGFEYAFFKAVGIAGAPERRAQSVEDVAGRPDVVAGRVLYAIEEREAPVIGNV